MGIVWLSDAERNKFADYLENQIQSNRVLMEQMGKLPGMEMIRNRYHNENIAYAVVLSHLRMCETVEIKERVLEENPCDFPDEPNLS